MDQNESESALAYRIDIITEKIIPSSCQEHFEHLDQPLTLQDLHRRGSPSAWLNSVKEGD